MMRQHCRFSSFRALVLLLLILVCLTVFPFSNRIRYAIVNIVEVARAKSFDGLGVASSIHVISLPRRADRRDMMEKLRTGLHLKWSYFDALEKEDPLIDSLIRFVLVQRENANATLDWPLEQDIHYDRILTDVLQQQKPTRLDIIPNPLLCATENNTLPWYPHESVIPYHMTLSRGMLACWFSHVNLIVEIARSTKDIREDTWDGKTGSAVIFEDDVDVEWDLEERLAIMWSDLPQVWDIVFLGHCWANESYHPALAPDSPLHPSYRPKCTHGYVLSPFGARRLLSYLTFPPFAFSRALDQAIAHLVWSGRLRAYSVVPAIVAQRRCAEGQPSVECVGNSDIWQEGGGSAGSRWRDRLEDSALAHILGSTDDKE